MCRKPIIWRGSNHGFLMCPVDAPLKPIHCVLVRTPPLFAALATQGSGGQSFVGQLIIDLPNIL